MCILIVTFSLKQEFIVKFFGYMYYDYIISFTDFIPLAISQSLSYLSLELFSSADERAVLVVNKRTVMRKLKSCTQLWQILI